MIVVEITDMLALSYRQSNLVFLYSIMLNIFTAHQPIIVPQFVLDS